MSATRHGAARQPVSPVTVYWSPGCLVGDVMRHAAVSWVLDGVALRSTWASASPAGNLAGASARPIPRSGPGCSRPGDALLGAAAVAQPLHPQVDFGVEEQVHHRAPGLSLLYHSGQFADGLAGGHDSTHPHSAPSTACSGVGPSPVPPCSVGSSRTTRPASPQSTTVRMVAPLCADSARRRTKPQGVPAPPSVICTLRANVCKRWLNVPAGSRCR